MFVNGHLGMISSNSHHWTGEDMAGFAIQLLEVYVYNVKETDHGDKRW